MVPQILPVKLKDTGANTPSNLRQLGNPPGTPIIWASAGLGTVTNKTTFKLAEMLETRPSSVTNSPSWRPLRLLIDAFATKNGILAMREYFIFAAHNSKHKGWASTVNILKDLNSKTKLLVLDQKLEGMTYGSHWLRCDQSGYPKSLKSLKKLCEESPQLATTVTNTVCLFRVEPSKDISSITDEYTGLTIERLNSKWLNHFKRFMSNPLLKEQFPKPDVSIGYHSSMKAGPNGSPAILTSAQDAIALANAIEIGDEFSLNCNLTGQTSLATRWQNFVNDCKVGVTSELNLPSRYRLNLARLHAISSIAGKTRLVYILNYWMQQQLLPLHNAMFEWLSNQPQDGTYVARKQVDKILSWTLKGEQIWSFDLTAATDRWPRWHQLIVIESLVGQEWAKLWNDTLSKTIAIFPEFNKEEVVYSVGQPMGAYASWGALAVAHHFLIRFLAYREGIIKPKYVVLGDDVVIADKRLADSYAEIMADLGITISKTKSVSPELNLSEKTSSAEFAKQLLIDGQDLTPLSPNLIEEVFIHHQWWKIRDVLSWLEKSGIRITFSGQNLSVPAPIRKLINALGAINKKKLIVLLSDPGGMGAPFGGNPSVIPMIPLDPHGEVLPSPWIGVDESTYLTLKLEILDKRLQDKASKLLKLRNYIKGGCSGTKLQGWGLESDNHPIWGIFDKLEGATASAIYTIAKGETPLRVEELIADVDFLQAMVDKEGSYKSWKDNKSRRLKISANLSYQLHLKCLETVAAAKRNQDLALQQKLREEQRKKNKMIGFLKMMIK